MKQTIEDIRNMLQDGLFRDEQHIRFSLVGNLSATNNVSHCRSAMRAIGYNPDTDLVIGYTFTDKSKF